MRRHHNPRCLHWRYRGDDGNTDDNHRDDNDHDNVVADDDDHIHPCGGAA